MILIRKSLKCKRSKRAFGFLRVMRAHEPFLILQTLIKCLVWIWNIVMPQIYVR